MTITEFLLARIAEDERAWGVLAEETWSANPPIYSPARVLAECEAKRRIIDTLQIMRVDRAPHERDAVEDRLAFVRFDVLCALATPYGDHPDYREEWSA